MIHELIARKTSEALLRERIGEAQHQKLVVSRHISELEKELSQAVSHDLWSSLDQHCKAAANRVNKATKERQIVKFNRLQSEKVNSQHTLDSSKLVVRQLSPQEEGILALGLSFAVAPRQVPVQKIVAATEALAHNLDRTSADLLRLNVSGVLHQTKPPKPNLTPLQHRALRALREDPTIVIIPADKGRATVLLNKEKYIQKMEAIVNDETKYRGVKQDPTTRTENKVTDAMKCLQSKEYISDRLYDRLAPHYTNPPQLNSLPKIHKDGVPMRPIVSAIGSPCYNLAKELARILTPLAGCNGYSEKNSTSFVQTVRESSVTAVDCLVIFDVTNLFT